MKNYIHMMKRKGTLNEGDGICVYIPAPGGGKSTGQHRSWLSWSSSWLLSSQRRVQELKLCRQHFESPESWHGCDGSSHHQNEFFASSHDQIRILSHRRSHEADNRLVPIRWQNKNKQISKCGIELREN